MPSSKTQAGALDICRHASNSNSGSQEVTEWRRCSAKRNRIAAVMATSMLEGHLYDVYCKRLRRDNGDIGLRCELFRLASSKADDLKRTLSVMAGTPTVQFEALVQATEAIEVRDWPDVEAANACLRHLRCIRATMWPDYKFTGPLSSISAINNFPAFKQAFDALRALPPVAPAQGSAAAQVAA